MGFGLVFVAYTQLKQDFLCTVKFYWHYKTRDVYVLTRVALFLSLWDGRGMDYGGRVGL